MYIFLEFNILLLILLFIKSINCLETLINDGEEEEFCSIENPKTCSLEGNVYQHPGIFNYCFNGCIFFFVFE